MLGAGAKAPSFRLRTLDGRAQSLEDLLSGGQALLVFFKVTCPVCQFALPILDRLHRGAESGGAERVRFFAVSQDDAACTREFMEEFGVTFPALLDEEHAGYPASNGFGISHVPSSFLVDSTGGIAWALDGFSRREFEALGRRVGVNPFRRDEYVPEWKAG